MALDEFVELMMVLAFCSATSSELEDVRGFAVEGGHQERGLVRPRGPASMKVSIFLIGNASLGASWLGRETQLSLGLG